MHPYTIELIARERQREFQREAEINRMIQSSKTEGAGITTSLLMTLGELLIKTGGRLQDICRPKESRSGDIPNACHNHVCGG